MSVFETPFPVWKKKTGMPVNRPEISQNLQCFFRQWDQPVLVALGVSNMDPHVVGINIADGKSDSLTKAQAQRVGSEKKDPITQLACGGDQMTELLDGQDIRDSGGLWRFDQGNVLPGLFQNP